MSRSDAMFCVLCARCSYCCASTPRLWGQLYDALRAYMPRQDAPSGRRGFTGTEGCETSPEPAGT